MKKFKGLIPNTQQLISTAKDFWQFGTIENRKKVIDPLLHYGCFVLGFDRYDIVDYVHDQIKVKPEVAETITKNEHLKLNHASFELADKLYNMTGYNSIFALSGSDANEGAVKLASAYHKIKGNYRNKIVCFENSYHGSTYLNYNMGDSLFHDPYYTLSKMDSVIRLKRDFLLSDCDWDSVMCIMVETCSYGAGLAPNPIEFWNKLTQIQKQYDVIVIVDDIFIGGGKTGTFTGWQNLPLKPDIATMGKAITAGFFPLSITMYNQKINDVLPEHFDWQHGFTYSFSLPGILSTLKYIQILEQEKLLDSHNAIVSTSKKIFNSAGYDVIGCFGTLFEIKRNNKEKFFIVPINATDEYFSVLKEQIA
jgi:putrescine aminotransferase